MLKRFFSQTAYILLMALWHPAYANAKSSAISHTPSDYQILATAKHNPASFTQGWVKEGDTFYESSGLYGRSFISRYDTHAEVTFNLPRQYFAEGLTLLGNTLYLLTWKKGKLLLIDKRSLDITQEINYQGEGWGLTHNGQQLIMSNGSNELLFRHRQTFAIEKRLTVTGLKAINELEYVNGIIWANEWNDDHIYGIHSETGCVLKKIDLSALRQQTVRTPKSDNIVNGIAFDKVRNGLWVTGKFWPKRYLIALPTIQKSPTHCQPR